MKFAKELEDDAVPEWRVKYLNYKGGKKKIKAISRALRGVNRTPATPARPALQPENSSERIPFTHYDFTRSTLPDTGGTIQSIPENGTGPNDAVKPQFDRRESRTLFARSPPVLIPVVPNNEDPSHKSPETLPLYNGSGRRNYGSIVGSPPDDPTQEMRHLELPDPAITPVQSRQQDGPSIVGPKRPESAQLPESATDAYHVGENNGPPKYGGSLARHIFKKRQAQSSTQVPTSNKASTFPRSRLRRMFTAHAFESPRMDDVQMNAYKELDSRQAEFYKFLDDELDKIETFYRQKEEEASQRLQVLRSQLHEMRDRRLADIQRARRTGQPPEEGILNGILPATALPGAPIKENVQPNGLGANFIKQPLQNALRGTIGKTSKAMIGQSSPPAPNPQQSMHDGKQDYVRRRHDHEVPYRFAKRRLKLALQEFYRALELLKSYALLNRTGFRKINKKYDKAVQARPPLRYMAEKVNNAYFVRSDVIDHHLMAVEDLYARYFERGNHKMAVRKLRSNLNTGDQSSTTFRNGLYLAAGICFGISGLVDASHSLFHSDPTTRLQTSYLLQLYGGYFLTVLLFLLFVLNCRVWTRAHINYVFVFEYDTRHVLDWRQLAEIPCFFLFLCGLFLYLNFRESSSDSFFLYWPVLLIALTLLIMALPFKILYYHSRRWWGYSNWRLLLAGLYPVEFRDFYLGDMYCSETYAMGQIELFFCLYVNEWANPPQCNSSHSRLLGFFAALPAIWRALQCLRRYYDSRNWFPHLANFAKYCCNILYYMTLSIYRIDKSSQNRAVFIAFAATNGLYSSFWDVFMDFSLGNPWAKHPFLRDQLAYKQVWIYYFTLVADVLLRQQWIFYAIFAHDVSHSTIMSFFVSLAEVLRRGMWSLLRVENEHCNNVGKFRASRDIPLPYNIPTSPDFTKKTPEQRQPTPGVSAQDQLDNLTTGADLERASSATSSNLRMRRPPGTPKTPGMRALHRVGTVIAAAHAQDFEKRRRPELEGRDGRGSELGIPSAGASSDDDDDEDEDEDEDRNDGGESELADLQNQRDDEDEETADRLARGF